MSVGWLADCPGDETTAVGGMLGSRHRTAVVVPVVELVERSNLTAGDEGEIRTAGDDSEIRFWPACCFSIIVPFQP